MMMAIVTMKMVRIRVLNNKSIKPGVATATTGVATATVATAGEETTKPEIPMCASASASASLLTRWRLVEVPTWWWWLWFQGGCLWCW